MPRTLVHAALLALAACAGPAFAQTSPAPVPGSAPTEAPQSVPPGYGVNGAGPAGRPPASPQVVAARQAARQACAADVAKLCADVQPGGGGGVMRCVREHRAEVSPGCGAALGALRDARRADRG